MKTFSLLATLLLAIFSINISFSQTSVKKDTLKVWGNCSQCKKTIETAAKKGSATFASWDPETKFLNVSYQYPKSSTEKIEKAIAASGYDTRDFTGSNAAYDKLHECCKYPRKQSDNDAK